MNILDIANAGTNAILLLIVVTVWRELLKCRDESKAEVSKLNARITNALNQQADHRARIAQLEALTTVQAQPVDPRKAFRNAPHTGQ